MRPGRFPEHAFLKSVVSTQFTERVSTSDVSGTELKTFFPDYKLPFALDP